MGTLSVRVRNRATSRSDVRRRRKKERKDYFEKKKFGYDNRHLRKIVGCSAGKGLRLASLWSQPFQKENLVIQNRKKKKGILLKISFVCMSFVLRIHVLIFHCYKTEGYGI